MRSATNSMAGWRRCCTDDRSAPSVQAATLHRYFQAETRLAEALHDAYPELLDAPAAGAVIGSLMGAALAAALICLQRGDTTEQGPGRRPSGHRHRHGGTAQHE